MTIYSIATTKALLKNNGRRISENKIKVLLLNCSPLLFSTKTRYALSGSFFCILPWM